ncbi:hypothetical protein ARMSODRAFT_978860 [Armillaria solidipes]|uniref:Uncharacterized protein n=1 Tax=Armillaria solidipes TaxID=1076256 RepID=A0A2H3BPC1_9AGAR|nr:hypothetical protein ARMSODRAFT_978860 [Armillaria solidipes]
MSNESNIVNLFYPVNSNEYLVVTVKESSGAGRRGWRQHAVFRCAEFACGSKSFEDARDGKVAVGRSKDQDWRHGSRRFVLEVAPCKGGASYCQRKDNIRYAIQVLDDFFDGRASPMEFKSTKRGREGSCQLVSMGAVAYRRLVQLTAYPCIQIPTCVVFEEYSRNLPASRQAASFDLRMPGVGSFVPFECTHYLWLVNPKQPTLAKFRVRIYFALPRPTASFSLWWWWWWWFLF